MRIKFNLSPQEIIYDCSLTIKVASEDYVYIKIKKGVYGLKEAAVLAYDSLTTFLYKYG